MFQPSLTSIIEGSIPILGGIYATLIGFGVVSGTKDPESHQMQRLRPMLKILGPLVIVFGVWLVGQGTPPSPLNIEEVVKGMKERLDFPVVLDDVTKLEDVQAEGKSIIYYLTITVPPEADEQKEQLFETLKNEILSGACGNQDYLKFLSQGVSIGMQYSLDNHDFPRILVHPEMCAY